jgi:hypothetical protein
MTTETDRVLAERQESAELLRAWAIEERASIDRYAAFKKELGLREMGERRASKIEQTLCPGDGFDYTQCYTWEGDRKVVVVTAEPYYTAKQARDHLRVLGFEAERVPGIELHDWARDVVIGVLGQPGLLKELIEKALKVDLLRRISPSMSMIGFPEDWDDWDDLGPPDFEESPADPDHDKPARGPGGDGKEGAT